ncbi:ig-like domain-containing protein [Trichonephila inaurata madagascariensis]|uniref:Ig-like domain-containing protein n=1 Tax=Trichonephila inaurata madagascariensis TaxID=2747483 RepID=A0A8X7C879_9ARAC|nr:ig-like domain-containing protein [Trichonephila inaurata madagascariensis]
MQRFCSRHGCCWDLQYFWMTQYKNDTEMRTRKNSPICKSEQETTFTAVTNRPVQIQCEVEADMDDVNFRWEFNGTSSGGDVQVVSVPGTTTKSIVNYTPRSENDFGTVYCWGTNNVGTQSTPCAFVVIPAGINRQFSSFM